MTIVSKNKNYSLNIITKRINNYHFIEFYDKKSFVINVIMLLLFLLPMVVVIIGILGTVFYIKKKNDSDDGLNDMEKMID